MQKNLWLLFLSICSLCHTQPSLALLSSPTTTAQWPFLGLLQPLWYCAQTHINPWSLLKVTCSAVWSHWNQAFSWWHRLSKRSGFLICYASWSPLTQFHSSIKLPLCKHITSTYNALSVSIIYQPPNPFLTFMVKFIIKFQQTSSHILTFLSPFHFHP